MLGAIRENLAAEQRVEPVRLGDLLRHLAVGHVLEAARLLLGGHVVGAVVRSNDVARAECGVHPNLAALHDAAKHDIAGEVAGCVGEDRDHVTHRPDRKWRGRLDLAQSRHPIRRLDTDAAHPVLQRVLQSSAVVEHLKGRR